MTNSNDIWNSSSTDGNNKVVELWLRDRVYFSMLSIAISGHIGSIIIPVLREIS